MKQGIEARLDEMQERCDAASRGPWRVTHDRDLLIIGPPRITRKGDGKPKPVRGTEARIVSLNNTAGCGDEACCADDPFVDILPGDAAFIAAARTDLPSAIAGLRVALQLITDLQGCEVDERGSDLVRAARRDIAAAVNGEDK